MEMEWLLLAGCPIEEYNNLEMHVVSREASKLGFLGQYTLLHWALLQTHFA